MTTALIVVDVQNDFADPTGSLYVDGGERVAEALASSEHAGHAPFDVDVVVATRDWHGDEPGTHFQEWPVHCVAGTWGARLHQSLESINFDEYFNKGQHAAAYSGFEGVNRDHESLDDFLKSRGVTEVTVVGLATDYCVKATALDAVRLGYRTILDLGYCAGVAPASTDAAIAELRDARVTISTSG